MDLIRREEVMKILDRGKIVIDEDILECESVHEQLVYLLNKVNEYLTESVAEIPSVEAAPGWTPCEVGDILYCFDYPRTDIVVVVEERVEFIVMDGDGVHIETTGGYYPIDAIGKLVFLTKAEAEKALAEMG